MESGTRKKRTLAERRESDKLRQRRFRAKKREEARIILAITGHPPKAATQEKKDRQPAPARRTAEEIRETNRIRQQRFRAKKRGADEMSEDFSMEPAPKKREDEKPVVVPVESVPVEQDPVPAVEEESNPVELIQRLLFQSLSDEKDRQTEIRREKDRIRKRRERQRKKENQLRKAGISPEDLQSHLSQLNDNDDQDEDSIDSPETEVAEMFQMESPEALIKQEALEDVEETSLTVNGFFDSLQSMSQMEQMDLLMKLASSVDVGPSTFPEDLDASSSSPNLQMSNEDAMIPEKKPWQRCSSSEERRERERMRKRMYRAKQKFISTGKLEMQWDPTPIKRTPNDDGDVGITPIPDWTKNLSSEQKLAAHRIYNRRYRERIRNSVEAEKEKESSEQPDGDTDFSNLPPEVCTEILSQLDLTSLIALAQSNE